MSILLDFYVLTTVILTCEQYIALMKIAENGNVQGAMMCDICGSWDWMGIPSECTEDCTDTDGKSFRYITTKDLKSALVIYLDECECDYCNK